MQNKKKIDAMYLYHCEHIFFQLANVNFMLFIFFLSFEKDLPQHGIGSFWHQATHTEMTGASIMSTISVTFLFIIKTASIFFDIYCLYWMFYMLIVAFILAYTDRRIDPKRNYKRLEKFVYKLKSKIENDMNNKQQQHQSRVHATQENPAPSVVMPNIIEKSEQIV